MPYVGRMTQGDSGARREILARRELLDDVAVGECGRCGESLDGDIAEVVTALQHRVIIHAECRIQSDEVA